MQMEISVVVMNVRGISNDQLLKICKTSNYRSFSLEQVIITSVTVDFISAVIVNSFAF